MQIGKSPDGILSRGIGVRISEEIDVVASCSWNLDVVVFYSWNLDVMAFCPLKKRLGITMSWLICLRCSICAYEVVVYVLPRPYFRYHLENKRITHNYFIYVVEKYFNCPNLCNIYLHNVCISELE